MKTLSILCFFVCLVASIVGCRRDSEKVETNPTVSKAAITTDSKSLVQSESADSTDPTTDIFARVWNLPESHVTVSRMGDDGKPIDTSARVVVHEQGRAGDCLDQDNAQEPLLTGVDESLFEDPTFRTFIALLDNYTAAERRPEITFDDEDNSHWVEVDAFLDAVFATRTMQVAIQHVQQELAPDESVEQIRSLTKQMWFEPYTNRYGTDQPFCVGFEHVFIGEDESNEQGAPKCEDRVGGYHSWVKFYLEQQAGKVDYLGYDYPEGNVEDALDDPKVATMLMRWSPTAAADGSHGNDLLKKPGGFFIGTRPELEIAFGMLALYAQKAGKFDNIPNKENHHRVKLGENFFDIVMHPQSVAPPRQGKKAQRGDHIRTLYPKFRGRTIPDQQSTPVAVDLPTQPHNDSPIQISKALPNPAAADDVGEWVVLTNTTGDTTFDLANWHLEDQAGRMKTMTGELQPGAATRIMLDRVDQASMMLRNGDGWILLFQGETRRAAVKYTNPKSDVVVEFIK